MQPAHSLFIAQYEVNTVPNTVQPDKDKCRKTMHMNNVTR